MTTDRLRREGRALLSSTVQQVRTALARPTASDVATIGCTLAVAVVVGSALVGTALAVFATVAGLVAALATVLLASDRPIVRTVGGIVSVPTALLMVSPAVLAGALVVSGGVGLFAGLTVWALVVAGLASGLVSWHRLGHGGARRGATGTMLAAVGVGAVVVARILPESTARERAGTAAADTLDAIWNVLVVADGSWAVVWFAGLLFGAALSTSYCLAYVPLERVIPPDRRTAFSDAVATATRVCSYAIRLAIALALAAFVTPTVTERIEEVPLTPPAVVAELPHPIGIAIATLVTDSSIRLGLLSLFGLAVSLAALEWGRRTLRRDIAVVLARVSGPAIGGALVAVVLAFALSDAVLAVDPAAVLEGTAPPSVLELLASFPPFALAAAVLVLALFALSSVLSTVTMVRVFRLVPARAIGGALAAGSVFVLAVGLAVVDRIELGVVAAAFAFVIWDIGEYADGVRAELGRGAETVRAEMVHVGGTLLSGAVVAGGTIALYRWVSGAQISDPTNAAIALGTGLLAVVLVSWALRG
ncbi:hypothetical protein EA462_11720 [Natrarchaeobius halalkaliphilus]|uniref:Uncharacterized protein n=1 Tax=Natrarchaeobius halalkaliphilus TaxID=1679091 RepID=A0A3N6M1T7_9EURY|nr:hypothetical protein [Natrarchaeobius halalkaliphilus]RQG89041.1 hypothetical protein EA462_11720 [Natrarchaeobius halalkaliphilus]